MNSSSKCILCKIAGLLVIIGALNWGLVGAFDFNLVQTLFGMSVVSKVVYILVGISGIAGIIGCLGYCPGCKKCCNT